MNLYGNILLLSALLCLATAGSAEDDDDSIGWIGGPGTDEGVGMANPAATYCTNQGYQYSDGRCVFPDGSSCDAWDFYRGDCSYNPEPVKPIGMPNPAATYCTNQGYQYSDGRCVFPDGSSCDAWDFYRGDCSYNPEPVKPIGMPNPASTHCKALGYTSVIRTDPRTGGQVGYCVFPDGSSCEEWAFYRGTCQYNPKPKPQPTPTPTPVPPVPKPQAPTAIYTCTPPPAGEEETILDFEPKSSPPTAVYYQGSSVPWRSFNGTFPATDPTLWIVTSSGWSWNSIAPLDAWITEVLYLPRNGAVNLYLMDFSGDARRLDLGYSTTGYHQIVLKSSTPGLMMAIFTLDGVPSNVIFVSVKADWTPCGVRPSGASTTVGVDLIP